MRCATLTPWSFHISVARSSQLVGFCLVAGTIRYSRYASAQTRLLRLSPGPERNDYQAMRSPSSLSQASLAAARQHEHADLIIAAGGAAANGLSHALVPDWPPRSDRTQPTLRSLRHHVSQSSGEGKFDA